jgi:hypothetical protein
MDAMVKYLENKGFEVKKDYDKSAHAYSFRVSKGDLNLRRMFAYPTTSDPACKDRLQRDFLDEIIEDFDKEEKQSLKKWEKEVYISSSRSEVAGDAVWDNFLMRRDEYNMCNYINRDVMNTMEVINIMENKKRCMVPGIKDVIFNDPATIILWEDGTKSVVKATDESYDPEKGMAMAIARKALGNKGNYYNVFEKWLTEAEKGE